MLGVFKGNHQSTNFRSSSNIKLIGSTAGSCVFNITTCDQYLAIVVPGRMFKEIYKDIN